MSDLDQINSQKEYDMQMNSTMVLKESYEARISELKESSDKHLDTVVRDKRFFQRTACLLGGFLLVILLVDILLGSVGWIRH